MRDLYRGFEVERNSAGNFIIYERGRVIDDASTETLAYDRIDKILTERRAEDTAENQKAYRR